MSDDNQLQEMAQQQPGEPMDGGAAASGMDQHGVQSANSFADQRQSQSQPGPGGKTAFIAKKER